MIYHLRSLLSATITLCALLVAAAPTDARANSMLQVVQGSGELEQLVTSITVSSQQALTMQWVNDQAGATGGTWQVTTANAGSTVIATGDVAPAPSVGHLTRFAIAANAFLQATVPAPVKYNITIISHDSGNKPLGSASAPVVVTEQPAVPQIPISFGPSANFPSVVIVTYDEKIGVVPDTQLHFAGADVTLQVSNPGKTSTDPIWLSVMDNNVLMRQSTPNVAVPGLKAGASQLVTVHLNAILPAPVSQMPEELQYSQWSNDYRAHCGVELYALMDWRGPEAKAPVNDHLKALLAPSGWADYAKVPPSTPICYGKQCVSACQIAKNIHSELDGHVVGYSFFAGLYPKFNAYGQARTSANAPASNFTSKTKITVASVSKMVTAIAAVRMLNQHNISIDAAIGPYLPSDWTVGSYVKNIKFSQLLSHTSGIKDYGNVSQDYATLKTFFTQQVKANVTTTCQGSGVINPSNPINPNDLTPCYSNYNFAIFRIMLPKIAGFVEDSNQATRPQTYANQYVQLVQQNVFNPVGQPGVACKPPAQGADAFAYRYPGSSAGFDWGDVSLICGAAGWYLSVEDISKVLLSINARDGKILAETPTKQLFELMENRHLGWDLVSNGELEKNGGWSANCDSNGKNCDVISTSIAIFGPVSGPRMIGVLFMNSDISGGSSAGGGAESVLEKSYNAAITTQP